MPRPLQTALDWIKTPPSEPLTLEDLAEARRLLLSRTHSAYEVAVVEHVIRQASLASEGHRAAPSEPEAKRLRP